MVPYTFKTMSPPVMAVIWTALVFAGIMGLVLALKPNGQAPSANASLNASPPDQRKPIIDPDVWPFVAIWFGIPIAMLSLLLIHRVFFRLIEMVGS